MLFELLGPPLLDRVEGDFLYRPGGLRRARVVRVVLLGT
jgi:hypothetical protein